MENSRRTPNLYLAAYLVCEGITLLYPELKKHGDKAVFIFEDSPAIPILEARFYEGEARVEPRGYSFIIKDLKAQVETAREKRDRKSSDKNQGYSDITQQISQPPLGS